MVKRLLVKIQDENRPELTQEIPESGIVTVGSDSSATLELPDQKVAPEQFVIVCEDDRITLLCRVDGTSINGRVLPQGTLHDLRSGDVIIVGDFTLTAEGEESEETAPAAEPRPVAAEMAAAPATNNFEGSLTDVLEGLRAEEKFYFLIENKSGEPRRVYVENDEIWLGWTAASDCLLTVRPEEIEVPRAQIRKDWSGVVLYPLSNSGVWLNDKILAEPHRLKNDDRLALLAKEGSRPCAQTLVRFHEPTALLVLDSILPKELPPPISLDQTGKAAENDNRQSRQDKIHLSQMPAGTGKAAGKNLIFGYFTILEIIIMAIGTLITAGIIFLILESY